MKMEEMLARMSAMSAEITAAQEEPTPALPEGWVYLGERGGKPRYRTAPAVAVPKQLTNPVRKALEILPVEAGKHEEGSTCPHCLGSGRYSAHRGHFANEKCYRCHGKGVLDRRDLAFYENRLKGAGPICHIVTA